MNARWHYQQLRRREWPASNAWRAAKIRERFDELDGDLVKLEIEPEIDFYDDSWCESEKERDALHTRIKREGCWILVGYWRERHDDEWEPCDSIGGFIGDDWENSGYDDDVRLAALEALDAAEQRTAECAAEELNERATYASV